MPVHATVSFRPQALHRRGRQLTFGEIQRAALAGNGSATDRWKEGELEGAAEPAPGQNGLSNKPSRLLVSIADSSSQARNQLICFQKLAEEEGFEPTVALRLRRFSKPVP